MKVVETFFAITVADMQRATGFYTTTLGATVMFATPRWTSLGIARVRVGLFHDPAHPGGHTGLHFVVDDLPAAREAIVAAGGTVDAPVEAAPGVVIVEARDSEGNTVTLRAQ